MIIRIDKSSISQRGGQYAIDMTAAAIRDDDRHFYIRSESPAWQRWHAGVPVGRSLIRQGPVAGVSIVACRHRGAMVGERQCETCSGRVMAKVYACSLHAECTLFSRPIEGVTACRDCPDFAETSG